MRLPGRHDDAAQCACLPCGIGWEVVLDEMQQLRMALSPPPGLARPPMWGVGSG